MKIPNQFASGSAMVITSTFCQTTTKTRTQRGASEAAERTAFWLKQSNKMPPFYESQPKTLSSSAQLSLQGASLSTTGWSPEGGVSLKGVAAAQSGTKSLWRHLRLHAVPAITHISASANKGLQSVSDGRRTHMRRRPQPLELIGRKRGREDKRPAVIIQGGRLILLPPKIDWKMLTWDEPRRCNSILIHYM